MSDLLVAISNLVDSVDLFVGESHDSNNRINNVGDALEIFIKDLFSDSLQVISKEEKKKMHEKVFAFTGGRKNPPDAMLKNGDAIEIKKVEKYGKQLALNSSSPKSKVYSDDPKIDNKCVECEPWKVRDIIYAVGTVDKEKKKLSRLWFVYGYDYAAERNIYDELINKLRSAVDNNDEIASTGTKEIGKVKDMDPLKIADLRVRAMWHIDNPSKVFEYVYKCDKNSKFEMVAIINKAKYNSFSDESKELIEAAKSRGLVKEDVKIKNPNNPKQLRDAYLITYRR